MKFYHYLVQISNFTLNYINQYLGKSYQPDEIVLPGQELNENSRIILGDYTFKEEDRRYLRNIEFIGGDADFHKATNINLPSLIGFGGDVDFSNAKNINLPSLTKIAGIFWIYNAQNINLPSLIEISGQIYTDGMNNVNLPSLIKIGCSSDFMSVKNVNLSSLITENFNLDFDWHNKNIIINDNKLITEHKINNIDDNETIKKKIDFKMQIVDLILLVNELKFGGKDLTEQQKVIFDELVGKDQLGVEYSEKHQRKLERLMEELSNKNP